MGSFYISRFFCWIRYHLHVALVLQLNHVFSGSSIPSFLSAAQAPREGALASSINCDCLIPSWCETNTAERSCSAEHWCL